jgi:hypothetical protein
MQHIRISDLDNSDIRYEYGMVDICRISDILISSRISRFRISRYLLG